MTCRWLPNKGLQMTLYDTLLPQTPPKPSNARIVRRNMLGAQSEDLEDKPTTIDERKAQREVKHELIRQALRQQPMTCAELAEKLGWDRRRLIATIGYVRGLYCKAVKGEHVWAALE